MSATTAAIYQVKASADSKKPNNSSNDKAKDTKYSLGDDSKNTDEGEKEGFIPIEKGALTLSTTLKTLDEDVDKEGNKIFNISNHTKEKLSQVLSHLSNFNDSQALSPILHFRLCEPLNEDADGSFNDGYSKFDNEDIGRLGVTLRKTQTLTSLDLMESYLPEGHIAEILTALKFNRSIIKLRLPEIKCCSLLEQVLLERRLVSLELCSEGSDYGDLLAESLNSIRNSCLNSLSLYLSVKDKTAKNFANPDSKKDPILEKAVDVLNDKETAISTLYSLKIRFHHDCFKVSIPILKIKNMNDISQFAQITTLSLAGNSLSIKDFPIALECLRFNELQNLELAGLVMSIDNTNNLISKLPFWSNSLTRLKLELRVQPLDVLSSKKLVNTIAGLLKLNQLYINGRLLGSNLGIGFKNEEVCNSEKELEGYKALQNLLVQKDCPLTELFVSGSKKPQNILLEETVERTRYLVSYNDSLKSRKVLFASSKESSDNVCSILARNRTNQLNWSRIAPAIAFVRANRQMAPVLVNSILPLLHSPNMPDIPRLAGFASPSPQVPLLLSGGPQAKKENRTGLNTSAVETVTTSTRSAASSIAATSTMQNNKPQ